MCATLDKFHDAESDWVIANSVYITFSNLPAGSHKAAAAYDVLTTRHMLMYGKLTIPREIVERDSLFALVGDLTHTFG